MAGVSLFLPASWAPQALVDVAPRRVVQAASPSAALGDSTTASFICAASVAVVIRHRVVSSWHWRSHARFRSRGPTHLGGQWVSSASATAVDDASTEPPSGDDFQEKIDKYRQFLIVSENTRPFWYRSLDSVSTAVASMCFVTSVVDPPVAKAYNLERLEDVLNVSFLIKFLLLFWTNDWNVDWLFTGKGAFDLASCLPVLTVLERANGQIMLERTTDILQIFRFLRLLREALPSDETMDRRPVPVSQQIIAVLLSLLGTVVISATVIYQYESPNDQLKMERSFEDSLLYMVNIFAGRDPPWYPQTSQAKIASFVATSLGILFIPFLISRSVELFMNAEGRSMMQPKSQAAGGAALVSSAELSPGGSAPDQDLVPWASLLQRLDALENAGFTDAQSAVYLRSCCLARDPRLRMLDLCYGQGIDAAGSRGSTDAARLFAARLKDLVDGDAAASVMQGSASTLNREQLDQQDLLVQSVKRSESTQGLVSDEARKYDTSDSVLVASGWEEEEEEEDEDIEGLAESGISGSKQTRVMSQLKSGIRKLKSVSSDESPSQASDE